MGTIRQYPLGQENYRLSSSTHPIVLRLRLVLLGVPCMVLHNLLSHHFVRDSRTTDSTWLDTCRLMSQYRNISPYFEPIFDCSRKHINRHILSLFNPQPKPFSLSETYRVFLVATIYKLHMRRHCLSQD